jgi:hypothetical protein
MGSVLLKLVIGLYVAIFWLPKYAHVITFHWVVKIVIIT